MLENQRKIVTENQYIFYIIKGGVGTANTVINN